MPLPALLDQFSRRFGRPAEIAARAPGRVNLIGEHTDYNDGFVLPIALEQCTWVAAAGREDGQATAESLVLGERVSWPLDDEADGPIHVVGIDTPRPDGESPLQQRIAALPAWGRYVAGVAALLRRRGARLSGFDLLIHSDVPLGSGLSSSAALEVATALALADRAGEPLASTELADLCRAAEHEFAGVPCGIMDQYASLFARQDCALLLDCRSRQIEQIRCELAGHALIVVDSGVRHALASTEYARRQQECAAAVRYFQQLNPAVTALRDVSSDGVRSHASQMDPLLAARALHVVAENERTLAAAEALRRGDLPAMGRLMSESHGSLRDQYEVSCAEVDQLVELIGSQPGVLGARMTGGGFGGAVIALVRDSAGQRLAAVLRERYQRPDGRPTEPLAVRPGAGASLVRV